MKLIGNYRKLLCLVNWHTWFTAGQNRWCTKCEAKQKFKVTSSFELNNETVILGKWKSNNLSKRESCYH